LSFSIFQSFLLLRVFHEFLISSSVCEKLEDLLLFLHWSLLLDEEGLAFLELFERVCFHLVWSKVRDRVKRSLRFVGSESDLREAERPWEAAAPCEAVGSLERIQKGVEEHWRSSESSRGAWSGGQGTRVVWSVSCTSPFYIFPIVQFSHLDVVPRFFSERVFLAKIFGVSLWCLFLWIAWNIYLTGATRKSNLYKLVGELGTFSRSLKTCD